MILRFCLSLVFRLPFAVSFFARFGPQTVTKTPRAGGRVPLLDDPWNTRTTGFSLCVFRANGKNLVLLFVALSSGVFGFRFGGAQEGSRRGLRTPSRINLRITQKSCVCRITR